jgi:hypothetical protein
MRSDCLTASARFAILPACSGLVSLRYDRGSALTYVERVNLTLRQSVAAQLIRSVGPQRTGHYGKRV